MVENKIERENFGLGDFLSRNLAACNLASFHDSVGWSKERFNRIIDKKYVRDRNCALLAWSNGQDSISRLQLIHSLFTGMDREATARVVGFMGYSNFKSPVEVSSKPATLITSAIQKLKKKREAWRCPSFRCKHAQGRFS